MYGHRKLNATIGYSNPIKLTFGTACNIIVEKIFAENRIRYAQRGDYACLDERSSQTARRSKEAQLRTRDLPESKQHRKTEATINTWQLCNADKNDDMTF